MNFSDALRNESNKTLTLNGADALISTKSSLLDLFATAGSLRTADDDRIGLAFMRAISEDKLLATKLAFHARNIRGGLGERRVFRVILKVLAQYYPEIAKKNIHNVPLFGRWDDLFVMIDTPCENEMFAYLKQQLLSDVEMMNAGKSCSLLAKWLKTQKASSSDSKAIWARTVKAFGMTKKQYQKTTAALRRYIDVTEVKMCANEWDKIDYQRVPSNCMLRNSDVFSKHDGTGFKEYMDAVVNGEKKINSSTLFPFDIFEKLDLRLSNGEYFLVDNHNDVIEQQWKALPDYINGRECNAIVMADTSGSMQGDPMNVALSLAVYFAERNKGIYKDTFMTFSGKPSFVTLKGDNLAEKISHIQSIVANTNIEAAFELILNTAINNNVSSDDLPKALIIISDMQFDAAQSSRSRHTDTLHDVMEQKFNRHGYELPNIIYWNVNDIRASFQVTSDHKGVQMVSGKSASVFKQLMDNIGLTPYEAMVATLSDPMYDTIQI